MNKKHSSSAGWPRAALFAAVLLGSSLAGCSHLSENPSHAANITGNWVLDPASSDDFDAQLKQAIEAQDRKMRKHMHMPTYSDRDVPPLAMLPPEEPEVVEGRLSEQLRPANTLKIDWVDDTLEISGDGEPARSFFPGHSASRIDVTGAGRISAGWNGDRFVVETKYAGSETRVLGYVVDAASGKLVVTLSVKSEALNKFLVTSRYKRAS